MRKSQESDLGKAVLRDVSRSFYLTLRALPAEMREVTSVGYLLARASDTIADCGGPRGERLSLLQDFHALVVEREENDFFQRVAALAHEDGLKEGERILVSRLEEVFSWWRSLPQEEQAAVKEVVTTIISGQKWDLERFPEGEVVTLKNDAELEQYCYQVAGCVGEFWTEVGFLHDSHFANKPKEQMRQLGQNYGKGLQLINILRDQSEDEQRGRRYLPGPSSEWMEKAENYLQDGLSYASSVRGRRARLATVLPALLGLKTLELLESASTEELAAGVKIGRRVVKQCFWQAIWFPHQS